MAFCHNSRQAAALQGDDDIHTLLSSGCPTPEFCMPEYINGDCEAHCPTICGPEDMMCPGGSDEYGCPIADFCMSSTVPSETNPEVECPAHCPVSCQDGERSCSGGVDPNGGKTICYLGGFHI